VKQDHGQFSDATSKQLPASLPVGERVIWQGKPSFAGLALRTFHIREVAIYFGIVLVWRLGSDGARGVPALEMVSSALLLSVAAFSAIAVLAGLAWLFRRASCYTITSKRVLFQFGVALPVTMNIPLGKIANAAVKTYRDGSGNIPLQLADGKRVSYLLLWPHIRPWRLRAPEPMLNGIPDAAKVAVQLAEALGGPAGPAAISLAQCDDAGSVPDAKRDAPSSVAA
jgi:hypothetical protein